MPRESGRALLVLLALVAVGAVGYLLLGNPFGGSGDDIHRAGPEGEAAATRTVEAEEATAAAAATPSGLKGVYGEGDLGAVRLRLLDVKKNAVTSQEVRLVARGGDAWNVSTGSDGVALLERVAPARGYRLEIQGAAFHPVTLQGVTVKARETTDLGDIILGTNVVLQGRVVDVAGIPVPDAAVMAFKPERSMAVDGFLSSMVAQATAFPTPADQATTDEDGRFTLAALPQGVWRLVVRKSGYATKQEPEVVLSEDRAAKSLTITLAAGATVKGRVADETGKVVVGARVIALRDYGMRWQPSQGVEREAGKTDDQGRYLIDTLSQGGQYRFGVLADGFAPLFDAQGQEVEQVLERDFTLARGGILTGVVKDKATGEPVVGAEVTAITGRMPMGPRGGGGQGGDDRVAAGSGRTDAEGRFVFEGLLPGPVAMGQVKAAGYVPMTASPFMGGSWGDITAGETLDVELLLERGGALEGTLLDAASGAPIPGATVSVVPRENPWMIFMSGAASATTDTVGKFRVEGVRPGKYGLVAAADGYASPLPTDEATSVTVPDDGSVPSVSVKLTAAGTVRGVVKDAKGEVVAGARVRARAAPEPQRGGRGGMGNWRAFLPGAVTSDLSDQEGGFQIAGLAAGDRWVLTAESDDYVPVDSEAFTVQAGELKEVNLVVVGGGAINGRVVDDRGRFVEAARVRVGFLPPEQMLRRNLSGWEMDRFLDPKVWFTDNDGRFLATNLKPGRTLVKVEKDGFVTYYKRDVEVRPDETLGNYVASLSRGEVVEGVVKGDDGRGLAGAMVAVTVRRNPGAGDDEAEGAVVADDAVEPQLSGQTDAEGRFKIENVMPGKTYTVVVWFANGYLGWAGPRSEKAIRRDVAVPARDLVFELEKAPAGAPTNFRPGAGGFGGRAGGRPRAPAPAPVGGGGGGNR